MSEEGRADNWDAYPSGLKVLAVDDDPLCLKVVEQMLRLCKYEVTTADNGKDALAKLRDKNCQIDLVLSDVYMPDMDGFKLLETIGLELDLPVIMMSSNGETPVVLRGVTHGAVDFLIKPVRIEELRNVWQHVVRRRRDQAQNSREYSGDDEVVDGNRVDKKRKESPTQMQRDGEENASAKKPRVVWSVEMHQQFVNAVNSLGIDKAVPKRILDQMNVEGLTRENVASHLQKYRLYLKRVAGVHVHPSGRGKSLRNPSMDSQQTYAQMMMPGQMGGLALGSPLGSLSEQEQLQMQLQLQQMRGQQQAMTSQQPFCKSEGLMMATGVVPPFQGSVNGMPGVDYSHIGPAVSPVSSIGNDAAAVGPGGAPGLRPMRSGNYDAASLGPHHQGYEMGGMGPMTSHDLIYPDAMLRQQPAALGSLDMSHAHDRPHDGLQMQHSGQLDTGDGLANVHADHPTEQEMEKFINIFLQPNV